jgi:hypothetical protein
MDIIGQPITHEIMIKPIDNLLTIAFISFLPLIPVTELFGFYSCAEGMPMKAKKKKSFYYRLLYGKYAL